MYELTALRGRIKLQLVVAWLLAPTWLTLCEGNPLTAVMIFEQDAVLHNTVLSMSLFYNTKDARAAPQPTHIAKPPKQLLPHGRHRSQSNE